MLFISVVMVMLLIVLIITMSDEGFSTFTTVLGLIVFTLISMFLIIEEYHISKCERDLLRTQFCVLEIKAVPKEK